LAEVEVDEVLSLMGHVRSKVSPNNTVPCRVVTLVEFLLDVSSYFLLDVIFRESSGRAIDSILLHLLRHVSILNNSSFVRHVYFLFIDYSFLQREKKARWHSINQTKKYKNISHTTHTQHTKHPKGKKMQTSPPYTEITIKKLHIPFELGPIKRL